MGGIRPVGLVNCPIDTLRAISSNEPKELYTSYNKYFEGKNLYCNLTNVSSILCKTITKWHVVAYRVSVAITVCKQSWVGNVSRNHVTSLVVYI